MSADDRCRRLDRFDNLQEQELAAEFAAVDDLAEELGEISACVTKGRPKDELSEELADLFILLVGTALAQNIDLRSAFWTKMEKIGKRGSRMINGRIRVSDFCKKQD